MPHRLGDLMQNFHSSACASSRSRKDRARCARPFLGSAAVLSAFAARWCSIMPRRVAR
jgi:hypothetical protein